MTESADGASAKLSMPIQTPRRLNWLFRFPADAKRKFELDSTGLLVWQMCDGRNSVKKIANLVAMRTNASTTEAETATLKFLTTLEARNLIRVNEHD
ncbi:MAG: PqqD family protein [Anaerolineae bacterium]|nr:PqqD family protein [Phycisphaerae bacterium]